MRITPASGLSSDEISQLIREAENSIDSDKRLRELIATRNRLESLVHNTKKTFGEFGASLSPGERESGEKALHRAESAHTSESLYELKEAMTGVESLANQLTMAMLGGMDELSPADSEGSH